MQIRKWKCMLEVQALVPALHDPVLRSEKMRKARRWYILSMYFGGRVSLFEWLKLRDNPIWTTQEIIYEVV